MVWKGCISIGILQVIVRSRTFSSTLDALYQDNCTGAGSGSSAAEGGSMTEPEEILHEKFELIQTFAQDRRLKISKTDDGEKIITSGRVAHLSVFAHGVGRRVRPGKVDAEDLGKS